MKKTANILILGAILTTLPLAASSAARDIYTEKGDVVIEKVTEDDMGRLVRLLDDSDPTVRFRSHYFLASFGKKAVPYLIKGLKEDKNKAEVLNILGEIKDAGSINDIAAYADSDDPNVAAAARSALVGMWGQSAPVFARMLEEKKDAADITDLMASMPPNEEAAGKVRKLLKSEDPELRGLAVSIIGRWGDKQSMPDILALLKDKDSAVREKALSAYGNVAVKYDQRLLADLLKDEKEGIRKEAARLLSRTEGTGPYVEERLAEAARSDKSNEVREQALYALGALKSQKALLILLDALKDPDPDVRNHALGGLGELGDEAAVPYIIKPFEDGKELDEQVIGSSCLALIQINKPVNPKVFNRYLLKSQSHDAVMGILLLVKKFAPDFDKEESARMVDSYLSGGANKTAETLAVEVRDGLRQKETN